MYSTILKHPFLRTVGSKSLSLHRNTWLKNIRASVVLKRQNYFAILLCFVCNSVCSWCCLCVKGFSWGAVWVLMSLLGVSSSLYITALELQPVNREVSPETYYLFQLKPLSSQTTTRYIHQSYTKLCAVRLDSHRLKLPHLTDKHQNECVGPWRTSESWRS